MYINEEELTELMVGKVVTALFLDKDCQHYVRFQTTTRNMDFYCEGDCCSEAWFADLLGVENLTNATIIAVIEKPMDDYDVCDGRGRQESDCVYGFTFKTTKGDFDLIFRNSSNGYYGGWLDKMLYYAASECVYWMQITEDYPC